MTNIRFGNRSLTTGRTIFFPPDWQDLLESTTAAEIRLVLDDWFKEGAPLNNRCTLAKKDNPKGHIKLYKDQLDRIRKSRLTISESVRQAIAWRFLS